MKETVSAHDQDNSSWALWRHWRGAPDLIAHIARKSAGLAGSGATLAIDLYVDGDIETFASADDFASHATEQGLREFALLRMRTESELLKVDLSIVRRRHASAPAWLDEGVLLDVRGGGRERTRARDALASAISRGKFLRKRPWETGDDSASLNRRATNMHDRRHMRRTLHRVGVGMPLLWAAICLGLLMPTALAGDGIGSTTAAIATGAVAGLAVPLFAAGIFPNISISTISRRGLILRGLSGLPIGALIGLIADSLP